MSKKLKYGFILISVLIILVFTLRGKISGEKFDSEKWKNSNLNSEENWTLRWDMMNSLRNNYELKGKSKTEILQLLGKPDSETKDDFSYYLGYSKNGINTGRLTFSIDNKGNIIDFDVWDG